VVASEDAHRRKLAYIRIAKEALGPFRSLLGPSYWQFRGFAPVFWDGPIAAPKFLCSEIGLSGAPAIFLSDVAITRAKGAEIFVGFCGVANRSGVSP